MCADKVQFELISLHFVNLSINKPLLYCLLLLSCTLDFSTTEIITTAQTTGLPDTTTGEGQ